MTRTPKQSAAVQRNWRIFQLRGLHAQLGWLTGERLTAARALVDDELRLLGAKTTGEKHVETVAKWEAMDA